MTASLLTRSFNNHRTGCNLEETILTPEGVRAHGIRLLYEIRLPGDARGMEAQPLVVPDLEMADGKRHEVLFAATMNNDVAAYDAATGELLWHQHLANPVKSDASADMFRLADHWGILFNPGD